VLNPPLPAAAPDGSDTPPPTTDNQ
jgi:hypothetical protein